MPVFALRTRGGKLEITIEQLCDFRACRRIDRHGYQGDNRHQPSDYPMSHSFAFGYE